MSARLYVVAFPELAPADAQLLAALRARYHPTQADRIGPHFTFAFAVPAEAEGELGLRVNAVAAVTAPVAFTLRRVQPIADPASGRAYITLVPHRGHLAMIDLHRALHEGPLERYREPSIRFEPHLTVGLFDTADESVARTADRIAADMRDAGAGGGISGRLAALTIVAETPTAITERLRVPLMPAA
ncbi:MAG TPA: 2'-5' RNA ligase family protein [Vineibacter sp.]|nr:2'-5' RNA ligase family protein [Vineibacter sp.]